MIVIPIPLSPSRYNVFIALEEKNLERMKAHDPAQFEPAKMGLPFSAMELNTILIGYATQDDIEEARKMVAEGKGHEIPRRMSRGFQFRPEAGDSDGPYKKV